MPTLLRLLACLLPLAAGAAGSPADEFWQRLCALRGQAFEGRMVEGTAAADAAFGGQRLVMHVRECGPEVIRIPFHVGADRSRTWVITRTATGLRLKHDHRHADGREADVTRYGGDTTGPGTAAEQEFPADAFTAGLIPAAATNLWTLIVEPGAKFSYGLRREAEQRRFRVEFDLTQPVEPPPAPWGHE